MRTSKEDPGSPVRACAKMVGGIMNRISDGSGISPAFVCRGTIPSTKRRSTLTETVRSIASRCSRYPLALEPCPRMSTEVFETTSRSDERILMRMRSSTGRDRASSREKTPWHDYELARKVADFGRREGAVVLAALALNAWRLSCSRQI